jgi:uncharacterized protein (DUF1501 family)
MKTNRREFLVGCSTAAAVLAGSRLGLIAVGDAATAASNREVVVMVFLRGGMDGLTLIPPIAGEDREHYEVARPVLKVPLTGTGAALPLNEVFGLHPAGGPLLPLFQAGKLAVVHGVGSAGSRSHFEAQKYIELGTPGSQSVTSGWLTRHLLSSPGIGSTVLAPALATGVTPPTSLQQSSEVIYLDDALSFNLSQIGHWSWAYSDQRIALRRILGQGGTFAHEAGLEALNAASIIENYVTASYQPAVGVKYPDGPFGNHLKLVAQMIKLQVGVRVATVDLGGWDTHENQGNHTNGQFSNLLTLLAQGLAALYADLDGSGPDPHVQRLTVVVQSEFGRRIRENARNGTDHGTANSMLVLGGNVRGGFHGTWPGLHPDARFDGADLAPTADFRRILAEILIRRLGNPKLGEVFPKYEGYTPLGIVSGTDLAPDYSVPVPPTPTGLTARREGETAPVILTWPAVATATGYRIERRGDGTAAWQGLVSLGAFQLTFEDGAAPAGLAVGYRIQALTPYGESAFGDPVTPTLSTASPLEAWRLKHFGTTENVGDAADDRVLTADGLTNFTKYALGIDPRISAGPASGFTPGRPVTRREGGTFSLVYVRPVERSDVRYEVRYSRDLRSWEPVAETREGVSDGRERVRASVTMGDTPAQFLRLTVRPA